MDTRDVVPPGRALLALVAIALLTSSAVAGGAPPPTSDYGDVSQADYYYVFVLDPSFAGNGHPFDVNWLTDLVDGIANNPTRGGTYAFGLVVPEMTPGGMPGWTQHTFASGIRYGTAAEMAEAIEFYAYESPGHEGVDGLGGIVEAATYPWTEVLTLVTDAPREDWGATYDEAFAALDVGGSLPKNLNTVVDHGFADSSGDTAMGTYWNSFPPSAGLTQTFTSQPDGSLPYTKTKDGGPVEGGEMTTRWMYVQLAYHSDGSAWDIAQAQSVFASGSEAFRRGFSDVKVEELGGFGGGGGYVPEPSTWVLMLSAGGVLALLSRRRREA